MQSDPIVNPLVPPGPIAVLGAGNMGSGIAQTCAQAGFRVRVRDVSESMIERGRSLMQKMIDGAVARKKLSEKGREELLGRIEYTTELGPAVQGTGLVIEAIFEDGAQKRALFHEVARSVDDGTIVVTNTSSLSVSRLAEGFPKPERFAGLHFFYPAQVNRLLEVIGGSSTAPAALEQLESLAYRMRKIPIRVRDRAGFAVNRYFVPYLNEATRIAEEGIASLQTIETAGREAFGASLGPFELMNVTGIPIAVHSEESLASAFGRAYAPTALLRKQFESGQPWPWKESTLEPERLDVVQKRFLGLVLGIATRLVEEGVATPEATDRGAVVGLRWKKGPFTLLSEIGVPGSLELVEAYASRWTGDFPVSAEFRERAHRGESTWPLQFVRTERSGPVAWVLLDRPEVLNSLNSAVLGQLDSAFSALATEPTLRCVVLAGSSPVFAAGADIAEMADKNPAEGMAFGFTGQAVCQKIETFPHPVIALVEGYALGGGLELALSADFIVASAGAQIGLPEATVGIHPGFGGASRLTRLIGRARTKYLVYYAGPISAEEAYRLGVVARLVPAESARAETAKLAEAIAKRAPLALAWVKQVIDQGADRPLAEALRLEGDSAGRTFTTYDRTEGMKAFKERRAPVFEGR